MVRRCELFLVACVLIGLRPTFGSLLGNENLVVQFGTYDAMLQQCFFHKLYHGMISPQSVTFNNAAANKAIKFISVESNQGFDHGGISAAITSGTVGTGKVITLQVNATPSMLKFLNNVTIKMYCEK
ncbi:uncharacterized protein LOC128727021 [Anopheles nili]|uniref:uncharacterized protein LOC128727021 n=1 Tax=Anopheles nili TaxID=185578 RepID=UPI00237B752E|nr:uncharacterized protein LOC128727021 [Anopheles nili]